METVCAGLLVTFALLLYHTKMGSAITVIKQSVLQSPIFHSFYFYS